MADKQYIERDTCRDVLMRFLNSPCIQCGDYPSIMSVETCIKLFDSVPAADVVPRAAYEQMKWERDVAMQQLSDAGIPFCGETGGKRDEFFDRHLGKPVGECMCREKRVIQNGRDESKEEEQ